MAPGPSAVTVRHNPEASRFEADVGGHLAVLDYVLNGAFMVITHTYVPPEARGRGIAEALVRPALAESRRTGRRVVPQCSYVARFIERHAEYHDLVARS